MSALHCESFRTTNCKLVQLALQVSVTLSPESPVLADELAHLVQLHCVPPMVHRHTHVPLQRLDCKMDRLGSAWDQGWSSLSMRPVAFWP